jgi:hypothetical protein
VNQRVLSHVFVNESMVISASAREGMEEMQWSLSHKTEKLLDRMFLSLKKSNKASDCLTLLRTVSVPLPLA